MCVMLVNRKKKKNNKKRKSEKLKVISLFLAQQVEEALQQGWVLERQARRTKEWEAEQE